MQEERDHKQITEVVSKEITPRQVASFTTSRGSVYTYDEEGKTTRFKTETNELQARQDITVFVDLSSEDEEEYLRAYRSKFKSDPRLKIYILERQADNTPRIIRDIAEVTDPDNLYLGIVRDQETIKATKASVIPRVGYNVFDTRRFKNDQGKLVTERHLGNKVVDIKYAE